MVLIRFLLLAIIFGSLTHFVNAQGLTLNSTLFPLYGSTLTAGDANHFFDTGKFRLNTYSMGYDHAVGKGYLTANIRWDKYEMNSLRTTLANATTEFYEIENFGFGLGYMFDIGWGFFFESSLNVMFNIKNKAYWAGAPQNSLLDYTQEGVFLLVQRVHYRYSITKALQATAFIDFPNMLIHQVFINQGGQESRPIGFQFILNAGVGLRYSFK